MTGGPLSRQSVPVLKRFRTSAWVPGATSSLFKATPVSILAPPLSYTFKASSGSGSPLALR